MRNYTTLAGALSDLRGRGYNADFTVDKFCLYCGDLDMRLDPDQFKVDEEYLFEGDASHEEDTVLVAITSSGGIKGILLDSYDAYAENTNIQPGNMSAAFTQ
jgi:hypothetical protein